MQLHNVNHKSVHYKAVKGKTVQCKAVHRNFVLYPSVKGKYGQLSTENSKTVQRKTLKGVIL